MDFPIVNGILHIQNQLGGLCLPEQSLRFRRMYRRFKQVRRVLYKLERRIIEQKKFFSTYSCYCIDGYTGTNCQTNWDECWSSPCQNEGTCIDGVATYNCTCPDGFVGNFFLLEIFRFVLSSTSIKGSNCEENLNECLSNPCQNGGSCYDKDNSYVCLCAPGFLGSNCDIDVAVCTTGGERCHNGGECIEGIGLEFTCNCVDGYKGEYCDVEIDECESSPCANGMYTF